MNSFGGRTELKTSNKTYQIYPLSSLSSLGDIERLPYSIKVILESLLRHEDGRVVSESDIRNLAGYDPVQPGSYQIPYKPARVILQDFTGVPAVVDLAAMRSAMKRMGGDPKKINPLVPVDLVIDHSVQVDQFASPEAFEANIEKEFQRNEERYKFLHWGAQAFDNFSVVPPATGIVHQINLEYLAKVVMVKDGVAMPDTLVGTDSHTVMINGLGVVAWGVGGIEAEAVMLGQPIYMLPPEVIGFELTGALSEGVTGTDLVLTITERLRAKGVVGKFVEFFGSALDELSLPIKAMIANMAPEYGATMGFFPVDNSTLDYMRLTSRTEEEIELVETYCKKQNLFREAGSKPPTFTASLTLDIATVESSLAGPKRPQDRIAMASMKSEFQRGMTLSPKERGFGLTEEKLSASVALNNGSASKLEHGSVVIAAITSCTNTSDPSVLIAAGLLAKNAVAKGLTVAKHIKTSLAPGSRVVMDYLAEAALVEPLEKLGFHNVGFGCTTCIGNSGPLPEAVIAAINEGDLIAAAVLSGNRNFEGRVSPHTKANYLASPPLVIAYALAGRVDLDLTDDPIGQDTSGEDVYLKDIWPTQAQISQMIENSVKPEMFQKRYASVAESNARWNAIDGSGSELFGWDESSTYIQEPPFFVGMSAEPGSIKPIEKASVLAKLGDSITTDHISPAGVIKEDSPGGQYLIDQAVAPTDFNSYGSRRGNDRVMTRGTFANIRLRNQLLPGSEGGVTKYLPSGETMSIYEASMRYQAENIPLVIVAGKDYGMGSSRDWAAKGTLLLGVKAVLAVSYERIHRSNLVGMGVLPLQFKAGESAESHGLTGEESFTIEGLSDQMKPRAEVKVRAVVGEEEKAFYMVSRIDTEIEVDYFRHGGILPMVIRQMLKE